MIRITTKADEATVAAKMIVLSCNEEFMLEASTAIMVITINEFEVDPCRVAGI